MTWATLANPRPSKCRVPDTGLAVSVRTVSAGSRPSPARYIAIQVGAEIAKDAALITREQRCDVLVGKDSDAQKIAIRSNPNSGAFTAKRQKNGVYLVSIGALAAEGMFRLDFERFTVEIGEVKNAGNQLTLCFRAVPEMFA